MQCIAILGIYFIAIAVGVVICSYIGWHLDVWAKQLTVWWARVKNRMGV